MQRGRLPGLVVVLVAMTACQVPPPEPRELSRGHVSTVPVPAQGPEDEVGTGAAIPAPVTRVPFVPEPAPAAPVEIYTVVVNDVPVRELLFALVRDSGVNAYIHPDIEGTTTVNAVDQTLPQILDRIARQTGLYYEFTPQALVIRPDTPFARSYPIDYVNMARDTAATVGVSTAVASTGSIGEGDTGANGSTTSVSSASSHRFWETLENSVRALVLNMSPDTGTGTVDPVVVNPEAGVLVVIATARQHEDVQAYIDNVMSSARRQVLVEATIVEVQLSDRYQAGVDWALIADRAGVSLSQSVSGGFSGTPALLLSYSNRLLANPESGATGPVPASGATDLPTRRPSAGDINLTVRLLKEFGDTRVLSSPKLMVLNNQTAVLKVVENFVYFEVSVDAGSSNATAAGASSTGAVAVDTDVRTVPIGVVMAVTPHIGSDGTVTLNVRPTITRLVRRETDPQPDLARANITNMVPVVQVREMESMLRLNSGQIAVLGGLMQDEARKKKSGLPLFSDLEAVGDLFSSRDHEFSKTELVIFMRPWVVGSPSVEAGDLSAFREFLPENQKPAGPIAPAGKSSP